MNQVTQQWDTSYEWKAIVLLALGFGLVGLDRWLIAPLFPAIMKDLNLTAQDVGNCIGILGLSWGIFAVLMGGLSDKIGRRKLLIPSIIGFSVLSALSGISSGIGSLLIVRAIMGVTEGSFCPTSFAATADASHPKRRGFNLGLQQSGFALFGLAFAPIIATQLLQFTTWRWVFALVAIPGLILGWLMYVVIREPAKPSIKTNGQENSVVEQTRWSDVLRSRNVVVAMVALFCAMTCVFVLGAMLPLYLTEFVKLSTAKMGFVASAVGFGGFVGQFGLPGLSDIYGRKSAALGGFLGAAITLYAFRGLGAQPGTMFIVLFIVSFFALGLVALLTGPVATEAAPLGMVSSTIGVVVGAGEIFGGGVAPVIAGFVAHHSGIQNILWLPLGGVLLGLLTCLFLHETAPAKTKTSTLNFDQLPASKISD